MGLLGISLGRVLVAPASLVVVIAVAHLEEAQVGVLAVSVAHDTLESAEKQCLSHHT